MPTIRVAEILEATTGGTRRHLLDLATGLDPARFTVTVIASTLRDPAFQDDLERLQAAGIGAINIPMCREIVPWKDVRALARLFHCLRHGRFDVVHTHSAKAGFLGRLAARCARVPVIIHTPHVFPFLMAVSRTRQIFYAILERLSARYSTRIVCVWQGEKAAAERWRISPPANLTVIENGIDVARLPRGQSERTHTRDRCGLKENELVVGLFGRFTAQKGHRYLIEAAPRVCAGAPHLRFLLIGNGELKDDIRSMIQDRGLQARFLVLDQTEDIYSFFPALDIFVLPSLWEGLPYSLLEAMACGRPVVATRVGGVPEVVTDGVDGLLVPPGDATALSEALRALVESAELRTRLGQVAAQTVAARFRKRTMLDRLSSLYEQTLVEAQGCVILPRCTSGGKGLPPSSGPL